MKKIILLVLIITVIYNTGGAQKNKTSFVLTGKVSGLNSGLLYLYYSDNNDKRVKDSSVLQNGNFSFKGFINEPSMATLQLKEEKRNELNTTRIFLEPSVMSMTLALNEFKNAVVKGSPTQAEYDIIQKQTQKVLARWKVVMDTLSAVNKRSNFAYQELKDWVLTPYNAEMREIEYSFFNTHPASYVTAYMLQFRGRDMTTDSLKLFYNGFPEKIKQSALGKSLAVDIEKRKIGIPGAMAHEITTTDIKGNKLSLADFKGKYVLLDFWASWCVPCRKLNPHLKELYTKYKEKGFEVIGVSDDDRNHDAWKNAVAQDGLPWYHVLRGLKILNGIPDRSEDLLEGYNVSSLPTHILIDPSGTIIGRYGEDGEGHDMLDKKLESVFK